MYIKQINTEQALKLAGKGVDIMALVPSEPGSELWTDYRPVLLQDMLEGCLFFRKEPAAENPEFAEAVTEMVKTTNQKEPSRKKLDNGKIQALRTAGWSNKKIADEMGVSEGTIWNRLKQMEVCAIAAKEKS